MRTYSAFLVVFLSAFTVQAQNFSNGQAARAVLGQQNFTAGNPNPSQIILGATSGLAYANGVLYVADSSRVAATPNDSRVVAFGTSSIPGVRDNLLLDGLTNPDCYLCGFPAIFTLGQSSFTPPSGSTFSPARTQSGLANATGVATDGHYFAVADTDNNRVLIWNEIPTQMNQPADVVVGQTSFTSFKSNPQPIDQYSLRGPQSVWIQNNKLFVADTQNNRVLIWNSIPTQNNQGADVVLGQNNFTSHYQPTPSLNTNPVAAANQLLNPASVTADATHLYVADLGFNRVLIWNSIPTTNAQNADVVVGQPDMTQTAVNNPNVCTGFVVGASSGQCETSLDYPRYALAVGNRLFIADGGNDRVLIFSSIPTTNGKNADGVLGQPDFQQDNVSSASISIASTAVDNTGAVDLLSTPQALAWDGSNLYVSDPYNRRVLVFTPGDTLLTHDSIVNWASEIVRQEGIVAITVPSGGTITAGDTVTITIQGTAYTYTVVKNDTIDLIAQGLVKLINAGSGDPNVKAIFEGTGSGTLYLSSIATDLAYDSITLSTTSSNTANELTTASGAYLSAGTAATGAIGMLVEINGANLADSTATATLDGVTVVPNTLAGVQVYMDGYACPILKASPTQLVTQVPYPYLDRTSTSVYVRTVHKDGSVTVTNATPLYIAPANPGIFNAPAFAGQVRPWPIAQAYHQPGNATAVIDFEGVPTLSNVATITINGVAYNYTVTSGDVTSANLNSIVQNMVTLINATDQNVTAAVGGAFNRVVLTAKLPGAAGNGISVAATQSTSSAVTLTAYTTSTCCLVTPNSPIGVGNPAAPGELIQVTGVGLGLVTDPTGVAQGSLGTGVPYAGPVLNTAQNFVTATMGAVTAQVIYAGLPTGSYGTYNVQMIVPTTLTANNATPLYMAQNAFISNTVTIPVGSPVLYTLPTATAPATTIVEVIDAPAAGSTVSGTIGASGWALNSVSALTAVNVAIDGKQLGAATIHVQRTDVCAIYSSPDCPNTGWDLTIDTTQFADGQHSIAITAISANGSAYTVSQSFSVLNHSSPSTDQFHGSIDGPAPNFTYRGVIAFSGWATYSSAQIAGISLYVDGTPQGAATYGYARTDVCGIYATPGCPNVGWGAQFDTNLVANGMHTLVAKAISLDGHTYAISRTFQVQNWSGAGSTTYSSIDSPSQGAAAFSGVLTMTGWAGDLNATVNSIGITVDGISYGNAGYGFTRSDVCAGLALLNCPGVGFGATLDTTFLADGQHTLVISVNLSAGQSETYSRTFSVANSGTTAANPLLGHIDTPTAASTVSGVFPVSGWAVSQADPITSVSLRVDGQAYSNATYGVPRQDVCNAIPGVVSCPNVGWNSSLNSALLGNGMHILEMTMSTASGHRASANTSFTVSNSSGGPGRISIDRPASTSNPFQGLALFSGWAINDNAAVSNVTVTVDGVPYGNASYGISRPDVCGAYPGRGGCPNVGWSYGLDTTKLPDGSHTLGITENNADGTFYTASTSFLIANYTAGDPVRIVIDSPSTAYGIFGTVTMSGWALSSNAQVTAVNVAIDGVPVGAATYGISRPDVCLAYPGSPGCPNLGWSFVYNTALIPNGAHSLAITAITTAGQSSTVSEQFTVAN